MAERSLLVTFPVDADGRAAIEAELPAGVAASYLEDVAADERAEAVGTADALFCRLPGDELTDEAFVRLHDGQVVQFLSAGVDHLPLSRFPDGVTLLSNAGAYAEPMAEHAVAMYLALEKRLPVEHAKMEAGEFDQFRPNRRVAGSTCGILGLGATGAAVARRLDCLDVSVVAVNRSGEADVEVDYLGTPDELSAVLDRADDLVVTAPLTPATEGLVDRVVLRHLADDGILVNVARGELVVQGDLYAHLEANPEFLAGIDAWWTEPFRHGEFELEYPFLELPNVLASPHNAAQVQGVREDGLRHGAENLARALTDAAASNRVDRSAGY